MRVSLIGFFIIATFPFLLVFCSGFTSSDDCDPGDLSACDTQCGPGTRRCQNDGAWGTCEPSETPECSPGEYGECTILEGEPPGLWFCSDECRVGPCHQTCIPGQTFECEAQCGGGQRRCLDDGTWQECLEYINPRCRPGEIERCDGDLGHRRCTEGCSWGECDGGAPCAPGEVSDCGLCASQACVTGGTWSDCTSDVRATCSPDETESCEAPCGPGQRTCSDECEWSACMEFETVACHPGDRRICPTTLYCGVAFMVCNASCVWGDCIETGD